MLTEDEGDGIDVISLNNGMFVWVWTSPAGRCEQGATHYKRRGDARKAGRQWLAAREAR